MTADGTTSPAGDPVDADGAAEPLRWPVDAWSVVESREPETVALPPDRRKAALRRALGIREFRGMVVAQVASEAGDQVAKVALAALVLAQTGSALGAAAAFALSFVPSFFGAALLGPLADRLSRRTLMLGADLARAVLVGILALLAVPGAPLPVLFVLFLAAELFTPVFDAARSASVPAVLGEDPELVTAGTGLTRSLSLVNQVVGLVLGGVLVTYVSARGSLMLDALSFLVSYAVLAAFLVARPTTLEGTVTAGVLLADLREGATLLWQDRSRRALVLLAWATAASLVAPEAVGLAYAQDAGSTDAWGAALMASIIAGTSVGSFVVGQLRPLSQLDALLPLAIVSMALLLVTGLDLGLVATMLLWFVAGVAGGGYMVTIMAFTNQLTPDEHRGRVTGLAAAGFSLATVAGFLVTGLLADLADPAFAVAVLAAVGLLALAVAVLRWPRHDLYADVRALAG